jgi:tripartite-type tricarboxylate transporter receptor subunit TctC
MTSPIQLILHKHFFTKNMRQIHQNQRRSFFQILAPLALTLLGIPAICNAQASTYPNKPIRLIVGFAPGGGADSAARILGPKLGEKMGQPIVIENRPGAGGNLASEQLLKADPDGYTLMLTTVGSMAINPHMPGGTSFNPLTDFTPLSQGVTFSNILVVKADSPIKNLSDFVAAGKNKDEFVTFGSSGNGSTGHLAGELLKARAGMKGEHINYKGGGPAMTDLLGGNITAIFASTPTAVPLIEGGKIRPLAVTSLKRLPGLPNVPTIAEQGYPGYQALNWYAFIAPPKMNPELVNKINKAIVATLKDPGTAERLRKVDLEPSPSTPQELSNTVKSEYELWGKLIKNINLPRQ